MFFTVKVLHSPSTTRCFKINAITRACANASLVLGLFVLHLVCSFVVPHITLKSSKQPNSTHTPHQTLSNSRVKIKKKKRNKKTQFCYIVKLAKKEKFRRCAFIIRACIYINAMRRQKNNKSVSLASAFRKWNGLRDTLKCDTIHIKEILRLWHLWTQVLPLNEIFRRL